MDEGVTICLSTYGVDALVFYLDDDYGDDDVDDDVDDDDDDDDDNNNNKLGPF